MTIAWHLFTPWSALIGGALIGLAAALYLLGNGRIAGISGILFSPLRALAQRQSLRPEWIRIAFLFGLLAAPWAWQAFAALPAARAVAGPGLLIAAGLLVGVGVRMANGCTSGHGVCGLARLSLRSLLNVGVFMGAGFVSVALLRWVA
ncbi:putative membrane protein YedE/YeeE [Paucibacter oligotrophus]|uniref:Putative membrane protein YedE/YeeE n=1 Tax=Roseateles oligotrophus TaxID=1769250 RepID=A0A840L9R6_9BURK|nr:YeeE/YedE thiosulfate transporter family protein [Roseateles oligotrophus]MBB4844856.1 putative membrane protein YedE/YeeE [Roseateles oligotrophus]